MRKVLVIGSGGAGKSTFAAKLARRTGLPLIHLDSLYWRPGWIETSAAEWDQTIEHLLGRDTWIIRVSRRYGLGTYEMRFGHAAQHSSANVRR